MNKIYTSTTIRVKKDTAGRIGDFGAFNQSFDDVLNNMMDFIEDHEDEWDTFLKPSKHFKENVRCDKRKPTENHDC